MSYFQDAEVRFEGNYFSLTAEGASSLESPFNYWHGPGDPSTWLCAAVVRRSLEIVNGAPNAVALELAAGALGISVDKLSRAIEWHEQYVRWHDGNEGYSVFE
jgi:hypothetical protein